MNSYLVVLVIDGATNLLWATALTSLDLPETAAGNSWRAQIVDR